MAFSSISRSEKDEMLLSRLCHCEGLTTVEENDKFSIDSVYLACDCRKPFRANAFALSADDFLHQVQFMRIRSPRMLSSCCSSVSI